MGYNTRIMQGQSMYTYTFIGQIHAANYSKINKCKQFLHNIALFGSHAHMYI